MTSYVFFFLERAIFGLDWWHTDTRLRSDIPQRWLFRTIPDVARHSRTPVLGDLSIARARRQTHQAPAEHIARGTVVATSPAARRARLCGVHFQIFPHA